MKKGYYSTAARLCRKNRKKGYPRLKRRKCCYILPISSSLCQEKRSKYGMFGKVKKKLRIRNKNVPIGGFAHFLVGILLPCSIHSGTGVASHEEYIVGSTVEISLDNKRIICPDVEFPVKFQEYQGMEHVPMHTAE